MEKNTVVLTIVGVVLIFAFLTAAYFFTNKPQQTQNRAPNEKVNTLRSDDHLTWAKSKKNLLIEYGDIQCPACQAWHGALKQIENTTTPEDKKIKENVTFVFRHFPLVTVHQHAQIAAQAVEAAGRQGKFFEMMDVMYDNQAEWADQKDPVKVFEGYAKDLKLNLEKFKADIDSKEVKDVVAAQNQSGIEANVNATPTFYLNGVQLELTSFSDLHKALLDAANKK